MPAVIYQLPFAASLEPPKAEAPLTVALTWGRDALGNMVQRAMVSADDTLFSMASNASTELDRKRLFELMRSLGRDGESLIDRFQRALTGAMSRTEVDEFELRLQDDSEIEQEIIASRIASRVEDEAKHTLMDFGLRVQNLTDRDGLRTSFNDLRPSNVCTAFRRMIESGRFDEQTRLILFKVFERQFLGDGNAIYEGVSLRLEAAGIPSSATGRNRSGSGARASYQLSPGVRGVLGSMGIGNRASQGERKLSDGGQQRVALMTQVLDEISSGWAPEESMGLQGLVAPLLRIALADPSFFSNATHPARDVLDSLTRRDEPRQMVLERAALLLAALQINEEAKADVEPLSAELLRDFLQARRSTESQMSARIEQARVMAHERIKAVGSGSDLPAGVARFLTQIWLPLASALHLKFGGESEQMQRMTRMLAEVFHESRWVPQISDLDLSSDLLDSVGAELRSMAVPEPLVSKAKTLLKDGLEDRENRERFLDLDTLAVRAAPPKADAAAAGVSVPAPAPAPAVVVPETPSAGTLADNGLWRRALPVGAWFRVFDRRTQQTRWLSAGVLYPQTESLVFTGFDASNNLSVPRRQFLQDVQEGKAEAVEPQDDQGSALRLLVAAWQAVQKEEKARVQDPAEKASESTPEAAAE